MLAQILAVVIFVAMFVLIITEIFERHIITLTCALLTILLVFGLGMQSLDAILSTLNVHSIFTIDFWYAAGEASEGGSGIDWATIIFIAGMMVMVEGMAHVGFFRWLCMKIAKIVKYKVTSIFMTFMILSFVLAMFIDSITVILFLAAVTIELSQLLKFNPISMILAEVFCANLGGSATMCGDPPNIIIGNKLHYSFADFIMNTGVIAAIALVFVLIYFYFACRKELKATSSNAVDPSTFPNPSEAIKSKSGFVISTIIFLLAVVLLVTHSITGLTVATIGTFIAVLTLITSGKAIFTIIKKVDYETLLFFIGLFVVIGGLEETGMLKVLASFIENVCGGNMHLMVAMILWFSAIASAFIDNIPFAATMIPVIKNLAATVPGANLDTLAWTLAVGTDIGGSATPIGASANVVGIATAAKEGHIIRWGKYCKLMAPATIIVLVIATAILFLRYL